MQLFQSLGIHFILGIVVTIRYRSKVFSDLKLQIPHYFQTPHPLSIIIYVTPLPFLRYFPFTELCIQSALGVFQILKAPF